MFSVLVSGFHYELTKYYNSVMNGVVSFALCTYIQKMFRFFEKATASCSTCASWGKSTIVNFF